MIELMRKLIRKMLADDLKGVFFATLGVLKAPNVRIDVACGKKWKAGREREKGSESTTNGRVSQSGSTKVSESGVAVGGGSGAGVGSIELVSLSMEQALW